MSTIVTVGHQGDPDQLSNSVFARLMSIPVRRHKAFACDECGEMTINRRAAVRTGRLNADAFMGAPSNELRTAMTREQKARITSTALPDRPTRVEMVQSRTALRHLAIYDLNERVP